MPDQRVKRTGIPSARVTDVNNIGETQLHTHRKARELATQLASEMTSTAGAGAAAEVAHSLGSGGATAQKRKQPLVQESQPEDDADDSGGHESDITRRKSKPPAKKRSESRASCFANDLSYACELAKKANDPPAASSDGENSVLELSDDQAETTNPTSSERRLDVDFFFDFVKVGEKSRRRCILCS
jgi:hypothetical protein